MQIAVQAFAWLLSYEVVGTSEETAKSIATFILQNIIYRWGTLLEIVTDNGAPFVKALGYLLKHYHITHIRISGYNSRANGLVERSHFDVRQC